MSDFAFLLLHRLTRYTLRVYRRMRGYVFDLLHRTSRYTLWIYGRANENPTASCQITVRDGVAYIDTLVGDDFYRCLPHGGLEEFRKVGTRIFRADVRASHLRLIQRALREQATVTALGPTKAGDVELVAIEIVLNPLPEK